MSDNSSLPDPAAEIPAAETSPSKTGKKIKTAGVVLAVLVIIFSGLVIFRDPLIRLAVCKAGTYLAGTPVELKEFSTSLSGKVHLKGFSVKNPKGYTPSNALDFQEILVDIDINSLLTDTIVVRQVKVVGLRINFETQFKESNIGAIQNNLNRLSNTDPQESPRGDSVVNKKEEKSKKLLIAQLDTTDTSVVFTSSTLNQPFTLPLPPVHLTDVGGNSISDTLSELTAYLLNSISNAALNAGGALGDWAKGAGSALTQGAGKFGKDIRDGGSRLFQSLKDKLKK